VNRWIFVLAIVLGATALGCVGKPPTSATSGKPKVVATFSVLGDFVTQIAGDHIELVTLVGADGDAHEYQPTPQDVAAIGRADVVFENGVKFEAGWFDKSYAASQSKAKRVATTDGLKLIEGDPDHKHTDPEPDHEHEHEQDPHVWHEVNNAIHMVGKIRDGLCEIDPANAANYRANADAYVARLKALDGWIVQTVETLPKDRRKLVTSHDTFGYFAKRYGFQVLGSVLPSFSTEVADPSAADFAKLVEQVRKANVKAIFCETSHNNKLVERLAQAAGVNVAPPLYTDSLGGADTPAATYEGMMRSNVTTIVGALKP